MFRKGPSVAMASLLLASFVTGCTDEGGDDSRDQVSTLVKGHLFFGLKGTSRRVEVTNYQEGSEETLCSVEAHNGEQFECDVGPVNGNLLVSVDLLRDWSFETVVQGMEAGSTRSVAVTPITHLIAKRTACLVKRGVDPSEAYEINRALVESHFGNVKHSRVIPDDVYENVAPMLVESVVAGVAIAGLDELAATFSEKNGTPRGGMIDTLDLLEVLGDDVEADGLFDGIGSGGQQLRLGRVALDGETLRAEYATALLRWLDGEENATTIGSDEFRGFAEAAAGNKSELFDAGGSGIGGGPTIQSVRIFDAEGAESEDGHVRDWFRVLVSAVDQDGVEEVVLLDLNEEEVASDSAESGVWAFRIDTDGVPDGLKMLEVKAVDAKGDESTKAVQVTVDNEAPSIELRALNSTRESGGIIVAVELSDNTGAVQKVVLRQGTNEREMEDPESSFEVEVEIDCAEPLPIEAEAIDRAGNRARAEVEVFCDEVAPSLVWVNSFFEQEDALKGTYSADGDSLSYVWDQVPEILQLGSTTQWPVEIRKFYTRLDEWSENLPTLAFQALDDSGSVTVEYRYQVELEEPREWTEINETVGQPSSYELPMSYQSIGTEFVTSPRDTLHRVEVRAKDAAGNETILAAEFRMLVLSPPVWVGKCRISSDLPRYRLSDGTLEDIYMYRHQTEVIDADVRFNAGLLPGSMAPSGGVSAALDARIVSNITHISDDPHLGPRYRGGIWRMQDDGIWPTSRTRCGGGAHHVYTSEQERTADEWSGTGTCLAGLASDRLVWTSSIDGPASVEEAHDTSTGVFDLSGLPVDVHQGRHEVAEGVRLKVSISLVDPNLYVEEGSTIVPYDFGRTINLPPGYIASNSAYRYRLTDRWNASGLNSWHSALRPEVYWFVTRPYISGFEIDVESFSSDAVHNDLENVDVDLEVAEACQQLVYRTTL